MEKANVVSTREAVKMLGWTWKRSASVRLKEVGLKSLKITGTDSAFYLREDVEKLAAKKPPQERPQQEKIVTTSPMSVVLQKVTEMEKKLTDASVTANSVACAQAIMLEILVEIAKGLGINTEYKIVETGKTKGGQPQIRAVKDS